MRGRLSSLLGLLVGASLATAQNPSPTPGGDEDAPIVPYGWEPAPASCIADIQGRALPGAWISEPDMTIAKCIAYCDSRNFVLAGLEYSSECHCAPFLASGASLTQMSGCSMPCSGHPESICGGPNRLSLYVSTSPRAQRLRPDFKSAVTIIPEGWTDEGCELDQGGARVLGQSSTNGNMEIDKCTGFCSIFGYPYAGMWAGNACYCDTEKRFDYGPGTCNSICTGDNMVYCGGPSSTEIYHNPSLSPFDPSANTYDYRGCIDDPPAHALDESFFSSIGMSVDICTAYCANGNYRYAGLLRGRECRCGNTLKNGASLEGTSGTCTLPCTGDNSARCGGTNAMSMYEMRYDSQSSRRSLPRRAALKRIVATHIAF